MLFARHRSSPSATQKRGRVMSFASTGLSHHKLHGGKPLTVTVAMAREISGLGNTTIWALIKSGRLESTCVGHRRLIVYGSLEKLLLPAPSDSSPQRRRRGRPPKPQCAPNGEKREDDQAAPRKGANIAGVVS
jgi:hypothetical protein